MTLLEIAQAVGAVLGILLALIVGLFAYAWVSFDRSSGETAHDRRITATVNTILAAYQQGDDRV